MPADGVNANPEDVRKLASALGVYQQEVVASSKRVRGALNSARWHDRQKDAFETRFQQLQASIDRFMNSEVQAMVKSLNELARRLDEVRNMRM